MIFKIWNNNMFKMFLEETLSLSTFNTLINEHQNNIEKIN